MGAYLARRIVIMIPTLLGVVTLTFFLVRVSGDPARFVLGEYVSNEAIAAFRSEHGLDRPLPLQFLAYIRQITKGDFGNSLRYSDQPVLALFMERLPATLELGLAAYLGAILVGIPAGVFSAIRAGSTGDKLIRISVLFGQAVPGFYLGLLLIILFSLELRLLPTGGRGSIWQLVLPAAALSTRLTALTVRVTRTALLDVVGQDFIRTARSKGLHQSVVIGKHAMRNAMIPIISLLGVQLGSVISGAAVTETVFSWPGVGRFAVTAIATRDYPVVQGTVLLLSLGVLLISLIVDLSYAQFDPRVKYA